MIDFTHGGTDTVEFHATAAGTHLLADIAHNYNNVLASTTVNDIYQYQRRRHSELLHRHRPRCCSRRCDDSDPTITTGTFENGTTTARQLHQYHHPDQRRGWGDRTDGVQHGDGSSRGRSA